MSMTKGMDARVLTQQLVETADWEKLALSSFANYHARGVEYLCLHRDPRLTVKAYFISGAVEHNERGWIVWPHTHRYAFEHWTLAGTIVHHRFRIEAGEDWTAFAFADRRPRPLVPVRLFERGRESLPAGAHYAMLPDEIHTISNPAQERAVAIQIQYGDRRELSALFAPTSARVSCGGDRSLYQHMPVERCRALGRDLLAILNTPPPCGAVGRA